MLGAPCIRTLNNMGILTPVRAFNLEFFAPVSWDDELSLKVQVSDMTPHSFSFVVHGSLQTGISAFSASISYVTVSSETKQKMPVPEDLLHVLRAGSE